MSLSISHICNKYFVSGLLILAWFHEFWYGIPYVQLFISITDIIRSEIYFVAMACMRAALCYKIRFSNTISKENVMVADFFNKTWKIKDIISRPGQKNVRFVLESLLIYFSAIFIV